MKNNISEAEVCTRVGSFFSRDGNAAHLGNSCSRVLSVSDLKDYSVFGESY